MTVSRTHTNNPHLCPLQTTSKWAGSHETPSPKDGGHLWSVLSINKLSQVVMRPLVLFPDPKLEVKVVTKVNWRQTQKTGTARDGRADPHMLPSLTPSTSPSPPLTTEGGPLLQTSRCPTTTGPSHLRPISLPLHIQSHQCFAIKATVLL